MKKQDWMAFLAVPVCLFCPLREGIPFFSAAAARLLMIAVCLGVFALFLGWPRRIRNERRLRALLSRPVSYGVGTMDYPAWADTGKIEVSGVPSGYSQQIGGDWAAYEHFRYEARKVYDGQVAMVHFTEPKPMTAALHSLPKGFSDAENKIPFVQGAVRIAYITDTDGTGYFVSARPL